VPNVALNTATLGALEPNEPDFRPRRWPWKVAIALNLLLALAFLGWPMWRGRRRAREAREAFAEATACLVGGRAAADPGVVLPERVWSDYATQVERRPAGWPEACAVALGRVPRPQAWLLFPDVKVAEAQLGEAVTRAKTEMRALSPPLVPGARIPSRPLEAMERVAAALTILARASGATEGLDGAVTREDGPDPLHPTRLPLDADTDAPWRLEATDHGLSVVAIGRRRVGWTHAEDGHVQAGGALRPATLRGARLRADGVTWLWATSAAQCALREDGCRQRALGVGFSAFAASALPEPTWLAGHPAGALSASVALTTQGRVSLLALGSRSPSVIWRVFDVPALDIPSPAVSGPSQGSLIPRPPRVAPPALTAVQGSPRVAPATWERSIDRADETVSAAFVGDHVVVALSADGTLEWLRTEASERASLATLGDEAPTWVTQGKGDSLLTTQHEVWWFTERRNSPTITADHVHLPRDARADTTRRVIDAQGSTLLVLDERHTLWICPCGTEGCGAWAAIAHGVETFDATRTHGTGVIAFVHRSGGPARVLSVQGPSVTSPERSLLPCFDRRGGGCGQAHVAASGERIVAVVRDGADVLGVETTDGGGHYGPASGL